MGREGGDELDHIHEYNRVHIHWDYERGMSKRKGKGRD